MADNDKFKIEQIDYFPNGDDKRTVIFIKTRSEYEDMIAEVLVNQKIIKSGRGLNNHTIGEIYDIRTECKQQTKAVVDRLFGEGE